MVDFLSTSVAIKVQTAKETTLFIAFIDLTKAFDLVSILAKVGCPSKLHSLLISFHATIKNTGLSTSEPFTTIIGVVKAQLAPTLFVTSFAVMIKTYID